MALRCLFVVQGEGRGHLTQAMALRGLLCEAGHEVTGVVVGKSRGRRIPSFFHDAFAGPVRTVASPGFVSDAANQSVRPWATLGRELCRVPQFWRSLTTLRTLIDRHDPDVVINFFEPLGGLYALRYRTTVPVVAVGHQYMFLHEAYRFPEGRSVERWGTCAFARLTAYGAARCLALSLYPVREGGNSARLRVLPPLLRGAVLEQPRGAPEPFFLVYILNRGYAEAVIRWHEQNPTVPLHCFWDRPDAAPTEAYDDTLTFHQLHDRTFLALMARCRGLVSTAGFESIAEAMYLDTPVQVVPVEGHYEQFCNAVDAVRAGAGVRSSGFDMDRLRRALPREGAVGERFRAWVRRARHRFVHEIEAVAAQRGEAASASVPVANPDVLERPEG